MTPARDAAVGDVIPVFTRETDLANWNRYAAVNDEFIPMHMDDAAGREAGYPTAFGMGNLQIAYLHNMLRDWLDGSGRIVRVACSFRAANTRGQIVSAHGVVTEVRDVDGERLVELDVWTDTQDGTRLAPGTATVAVAVAQR
jgi:acyl dehydratase